MNNKKNKPGIKVLNIEGLKIERALTITLCTCFMVVIAAQLFMTFPNLRMFLTQEDKVEGVFLEKNDTLYNKGTLLIELVDCERMDGAWVLVNGRKAADFSSKQVSITVKDADLIEIDGTKARYPFKAKVASYNSNINLLTDNSTLDIDGNIGILARIKLK